MLAGVKLSGLVQKRMSYSLDVVGHYSSKQAAMYSTRWSEHVVVYSRRRAYIGRRLGRPGRHY